MKKSLTTMKGSLKRNISTDGPIAESKSMEEIKAEILSGKRETKIIKTCELTELNPMEYFLRFLGIPEMIFQHLNGKDLIRVSEVSPSFYNFIASSKVLMEKIKIVFNEESVWKPEDYDLLKNSLRLYQNVEVRRKQYRRYPPKESFYFTKRILDLYKFLASIESSVENLSFNRKYGWGYPLNSSSLVFKSFKVLKFPKLKQLKFHLHENSSSSVAHASLFINSIAIEELELECCDELVRNGILPRMLGKNDKLTSLNLRSVKIIEMFRDESWKQFKFKLKSLTINSQNFDSNVNFRNFLKSQSDHLEELNIDLHDKDLFNVIMKMPKLRSLCVQYCLGLSENEVRDKVSKPINDLKVYCNIDSNDLRFLLESMPNIRTFSIFFIDKENFQTLLAMGRKFDELRYHKLKGVDQEELTEISDKILFKPYSFFSSRNF